MQRTRRNAKEILRYLGSLVRTRIGKKMHTKIGMEVRPFLDRSMQNIIMLRIFH
jgi:hypothetical protein